MRPSARGTNSTRKGTYIAAPISAMGRQRWPRTFIHADMATVMLVAMISAPVYGLCIRPPAPTAPRTDIHTGCSTTMPTTIATTISAKCCANFLPLRRCAVGAVWGGAGVALRAGLVLDSGGLRESLVGEGQKGAAGLDGGGG